MNGAIADIILSKISSLSFIDKTAGVVRPLVKIDVMENEDGTGTVIRKIFPVACNVTAAQCEEQELYTDLVPDSKYRSIIYFEDGGSTYVGRNGETLNFVSKLRLVCWYNLQHFDTAQCSIDGQLIASIIGALPHNFFNDGDYQRLLLTVASVPTKQSGIFSFYSYSEETNQYLLYPYDYFAIDFNVSFAINKNCISTIQLKTPSC